MKRNHHHIPILRGSALCALCLLCTCTGALAVGNIHRSERPRDYRQEKCTGRLLDALRSMAGDDTVAVWIFFRGGDRTPLRGDADPARAALVSSRAGRRIMRRAPGASMRGYLPVREGHIDGVRGDVVRIRRVSRYFNAVSADVQGGRIASLCARPFVERIDRVAVYRRDSRCPSSSGRARGEHLPAADPLCGIYGGSCTQISQIQAVELLEMGYNGSGAVTGDSPVLVCILDTGFNLDHEALEHVRVEAEWDFVQNDSITADQEGDLAGQERHGTAVLGAIAGHHEGDLIGPAWGAAYLLAKTEIEGQEMRIEEDNWIAAVEWADSAGADVVTSSLGYVDWYGPEDKDGNTAFCTRAADIAISHGIVVVNSAGNLGSFGGLTPPADGDSVITVGAVYGDGTIVSFSSRGPTADGRTKPELVAMGYNVHSVDHEINDGYGTYSGTSMAAPLVAGLCALMLEIHPEWSPIEVRNALLASATQSDYPDNTYGYGIPRGAAASGIQISGIPESTAFSIGYPNPFRETTAFDLYLPALEPVTARIYDCSGALVRTLIDDRLLQCRWILTWDGTNDAGREVAAGMYLLIVTSLSVQRTAKVLYLP